MHCILRLKSFFSSSKFDQYIKVMEVGKTVTQKELKTKFIQLAKKYHPDTGSVKDANKFKAVLEAYRFLSD